MKKTIRLAGKLLYAVIFLIVIPILLWFWAGHTEYLISFSVIDSWIAGWLLCIGGGILLLWGMLALILYGKGLPMNAYPPSKFVNRGPYRLLRHPIYWGFGIFMAGFFILTQSPSGLWLVTPLTIMGMIALVWGYERIDLKDRFPGKRIKTILDLPEMNSELPGPRDRIVSLFRVLVLLVFSNFLILRFLSNITLFTRPVDIYPIFESPNLPLISFALIVITPFLIKSNIVLRVWAIEVMMAISFSLFTFLVWPEFTSGYLPYIGQYSIITVPIFLILISLKEIFKQSKNLGLIFGLISTVLVVIQLTNSPSPEFHFVVSIIVFLLASNYLRIWVLLKNSTETIANSWREWVFGRIRVINHGFYVGFGAFFGILIAGFLAGKEYSWAILVFALIVIVFSALWAQVVEGSEKLKRPFGYYGAMVGILFASLAVWFMGLDVWVVIAVVSVVMPWVQAIGRLRCLVNGCCHGEPVEDKDIGIRYYHFRSRVCGISGFKGILLHPTPLYSIIWLFLIGFILMALWNHNFPSPFIFGLYLILTGVGRFVEEAYRGEVQTPVIKGLKLYQWTAILSVLVGIFMTIVQVEPIDYNSNFSWEIVLAAVIGGLFTTFAMGIDFPYSNARFSRLV